MNSARIALALASMGVILSGCSSNDMTTNVATSPPVVNETSDSAPMDKYPFAGLTDALEKAWSSDTDKGHAATCELWDTDSEGVLGALMPADSNATFPLGLTANEVRGEISRFFNDKCEAFGS